MVDFDSEHLRFIPEEERWEIPYKDNVIRKGREEFFVYTIVPTCDKEGCDDHGPRNRSSIRITRNFETQRFVLYIGKESVVEGRWADTPSGRGPNGHKRVLELVKTFARGWIAAEEEIPVKDVYLQSQGNSG